MYWEESPRFGTYVALLPATSLSTVAQPARTNPAAASEAMSFFIILTLDPWLIGTDMIIERRGQE
jgi:hypothetical protein